MNKKQPPLNPHTVGLVMRECARRAMLEIAHQRTTFSSEAKISDYKFGEDLVTSADYAAQEIYINIINENFPYAGIVAEESFARKCSDPNTGSNYFFTIDPLDGTKAFGRRQSHGVSTMIAYVCDGVVEGATIGDPNTLEIFHTRPGSDKLHRIYGFESSVQLLPKLGTLKDQYLQLRCDPRKLSKFGQALTAPASQDRLFKEAEVIGGSIGTTFTRLWKGEVAGVLLEVGTGTQTPWDTCPVFGISEKMGYQFFQIIDDMLQTFQFVPSEENFTVNGEILCIHKSNVQELKEWVANVRL
jgi:fructose-1,6-bisphosphatase/inositol monophosphatase family enzyme